MVNIQRTTNGKEEHVKTINCKGHNNDMAFLADQLRPYMDASVKFVVADVATSGVVRIIEHRYTWYVVVCSFRRTCLFAFVRGPTRPLQFLNFIAFVKCCACMRLFVKPSSASTYFHRGAVSVVQDHRSPVWS